MSEKVTIAASPHDARGPSWHVFRDAWDRDPRIHLEVHGALSVRSGADAGHPPWVELSVPAETWWAMVRAAAEARARGLDESPGMWLVRFGEAEDSGRVRIGHLDDAARPDADAAWGQLASEGAGTAARLAQSLERDAAAIRRAVDRLLRDGTDPLVALLEAALDPPSLQAAISPPSATTEAVELATLSRALWEDELRVWEWWLLARPLWLTASPLVALRAGERGAVWRLLRSISGEASR